MHLAGTKRRDIRKITDRHVEGVRNLLARSVRPPASSIFRPRKKLPAVVMWDSKVPGLFVRIGHHKVTWTFQKEYRTRGKRGTTFRRLGFYPAMGILAARKAALMYAGQIASGKPMPGLRDAVTLDQALVEYDRHLHEQSKRRGKPATWAKVVQSFARLHLSPAFGRWTLAEISAAPALVRDFHVRVSKDAGPGAADHCCRILAALYKHMAKLDRSLPPQSPCSAVRYHGYKPSTAGLAFDQFPEWRRAVDTLSPIKYAYFRFCLLTGARPGEAARIKWSDVNPRKRTVTIRNAKKLADIVLPMSAAIARTLLLARDAPSADDVRVFPGVEWVQDKLPVKGRALRRTYRTVAADLGINEVLTRLLMGHSLAGINQSYINQMVLTGGPGLREAQSKISRRIVTLLGLRTL